MKRLLLTRKSLLAVTCLLAACSPSSNLKPESEQQRLPNGMWLDPVGRASDVGSLPLAMVPSPDGSKLVLLLNGFRDQGVQVIDRATGAVSQTLRQRAAFIGLSFSPDGRRLYASGGNEDAIYVYDWNDGAATLSDTLNLAAKKRSADGKRYPAGIALSADGKTVYAAENLADSLAVIDVATGRVTQRLATGRYPYGVAVSPGGAVYVSAWGGSTVSVFTPSNGRLANGAPITVGRHPSSLLLSPDGSRLFVTLASVDAIAVIDTRSNTVIKQLDDAPPRGPHEGSTPNALALSPDGSHLYVAEADANSLAIFDLSAATSGLSTAMGNDALVGRVPTQWYPTAVVATEDSLFVLNAKGRGTRANPGGPSPAQGRGTDTLGFTLGQILGTVTMTRLPDNMELEALTSRVARTNGWDVARQLPSSPPIEHVIYIIKENRTYDQVFGDLGQADGDPALLFFPRSVSPNHHAIAERFGIFDRFFVNADVSPQGHNWSTAAYSSDYVEKTVPTNYSKRGRSYDYEGTNRERVPDDDVASPGTGYLWDLAERAGISFRNYGEYVERAPHALAYRGTKPALAGRTNEDYPGFDMDIPDQVRADIWIRELREFDASGKMPALEIVRLPNDHTEGLKAGSPTPFAYMADNDLALGRMIEALSRTQFWKSTAVFVLEDDSQNGSDHVDSHRSVLMIISPWLKAGVVHRFVNTTDVIATMEDLLKLGAMSKFDHYGRPLRDIWLSEPDLRPYVALKPSTPLNQRNPAHGIGADESALLDLSKEDVADEEIFNRVLWRAIKGESRPWPGTKRMSGLDMIGESN